MNPLTSDTVHISLGASIQGAEVDIAAGIVLHPVALVRIPEVVDNDVGKGKEKARQTP